MSTCYTRNGITYNEKLLIFLIKKELDTNPDLANLAAAIYKVDSKKDRLDALTKKAEAYMITKDGERVPDTKKFNLVGVNRFATAAHVTGMGKSGEIRVQWTPESVNASRKENYIKQHLNDPDFKGNASAVAQAYDEMKHDEELNTSVGSWVHKFVNILFDKGPRSTEYTDAVESLKKALENNNHEFAKSITESDPVFKFSDTDKIAKKILDQAKDIVSWVESTYGKKSELQGLWTEMPIMLPKSGQMNLMCKHYDEETGKLQDTPSDYDGIIGIADLVILDKDGKVHIIDFKISGRPYKQWSDAKNNEVELQLALYRAMMALGAEIDGNDFELVIKPIVFPKQAISQMTASQEGSNKYSVDLLRSGAKASRVSWRSGRFSDYIRDLGIGSLMLTEKIEDSELEENVQNDWAKIMGFKEDPVKLTKEVFISKEYLHVWEEKGHLKGYRFFDKIKGEWITGKTKEDFTKDGGLIDLYIEKLETEKAEILTTIIKELNDFKNDPKKERVFLRSDNNPHRLLLLMKYLGKYLTPGWNYEDNMPNELADHGILVFSKHTSEGDIIDIVQLASMPLDVIIPINGSQTLLGKFMNDNQANHLPIKPLTSDYKHVKALEAISILNTLAQKRPDIFEKRKINSLVVLNPLGSADTLAPGVDFNQLVDNFSVLCLKQYGNVSNTFDGNTIKTVSPIEHFMSEFQTILSDLSEDDVLKEMLTGLDDSTKSLAEKREAVYLLLKRMRSRFPELAAVQEWSSHLKFNTNNPVTAAYFVIALMYLYLNGINVSYDGRLSRWGLNLSECFALLGLPIYGTVGKTDKKGTRNVGLGGGLEISTPRTSPSSTIKQLSAYYDLAFNSVRKQFLHQLTYVNNICKEYLAHYHSNLSELISSANLKTWEHLLIKDSNNKVHSDLIIKNPWDSSTDLSELDRQFLKEILWEINKYRLSGISEEQREWHYKGHEKQIDLIQSVINAKTDGNQTYFLLPLTRAEKFLKVLRFGEFGYKKFFESKWEEFLDNVDPRELHAERAKQLLREDEAEMYNEYSITQSLRESIITSEGTPYNFTFDLNFLAADMAFQSIRKSFFDRALMLTETIIAVMNLRQLEEGVDMTNEINAVIDLSKISISGKPLLDEDEQSLGKAAGAMKGLNSILLLACRPLQFLKELTFGMFTNYSRAWALKYGSNKLSYDSVFSANKVIWGQQFGKYGNAFAGSGSLADFTMCEAINKLYGIANEDLNRIVENATVGKVGIANNFSRWMYIANSAPDYYNRLTLFVAKMMEDGCFEAHTLDEQGYLHYDWKKDKRFKHLAEEGLNTDGHHSKEYLDEKSLYIQMCEDFEKGGDLLITWDKDQKKYIYGDIDQAYTSDQKASIKEVSDMAYGYYDHEAKSILNHKLFGLVFLQFQTFLSAKMNLWFKAPSSRGGTTSQGHFGNMVRNGQTYYRRIITDDLTGDIVRVDIIPESELTEDEKGVLVPQQEWIGDYVEGLFYSIGGMLHDIFHMNWKEVMNDKLRLANVKLAMHDLLIGIILFTILKYIFTEGTNKMKDAKPTERILLRAMNDVSPAAITSLSLTPSFVNTWNNLKQDGISMLFNGNKDLIDVMSKNFGAAKDFIWED